ncbi:hypothetical protein BN2476_520041 [Paraburkholderia piptadeniae]|uniref:Uncharacterized protein n=1 Tax=Paraburkholderia piptadeniae TaxID=1701573 RepID=A0A1N7SGU3_9BURK|nr:hypothetical protein BN2476_520041 [Paraburkholderia piptadeniae]
MSARGSANLVVGDLRPLSDLAATTIAQDGGGVWPASAGRWRHCAFPALPLKSGYPVIVTLTRAMVRYVFGHNVHGVSFGFAMSF